jgi:hypothetical protein
LKVDLKRSTMANWVIQTAETYLKPFNEAFRQELLRQPVIHADETVLQVNKEPGRDATAGSRIWAYASSKRAERQVRYFRYEESRKGACAGKTLGGYTVPRTPGHRLMICCPGLQTSIGSLHCSVLIERFPKSSGKG